jgi:hypothetical protein
LEHCDTFGDAIVVLAKFRQAERNEKFDAVVESVPLTLRNWRRIVSGEVVPSLETFQALRHELCDPGVHDKFDALYIAATQTKSRFKEEDITSLIAFVTGITCSRRDTLDPACFRSIAFSPNVKLDNLVSGEKALAFFKALRSMLASKRLPARSDTDRQIRIAVLLFREALIVRVLNQRAALKRILSDLASLEVAESNAFIKGALIDLETLAVNEPEYIVFPALDKPIIDVQIGQFQRAQEIYRCFDENDGDPLKDFGFTNAVDDTLINGLRWAVIYGADEASAALRDLDAISRRDAARGAARFLTFYNDLTEVEALISLNRCGHARERIGELMVEAAQAYRSDWIAELRMMEAKSYIRDQRGTRHDLVRGIELIEGAVEYALSIGNEAKAHALQRPLMQAKWAAQEK